MEKLLLLLLSFSLVGAAGAQTKDSLKQRAVDAICTCMDKQTDVTKENARSKMMECFTRDAGAEILALATGRNLDLTSNEAMEDLGKELATELFKQGCRSFVRLSVIMAGEQMNEEEDQPQAKAVRDIASGSSTGSLLRVDDKDFRYLVLGRDNNETSYAWLESFPGAALVSGTSYKSLIGKKLTVRWQELDIYDAKTNGYRTLRQIKSITVNE